MHNLGINDFTGEPFVAKVFLTPDSRVIMAIIDGYTYDVTGRDGCGMDDLINVGLGFVPSEWGIPSWPTVPADTADDLTVEDPNIVIADIDESLHVNIAVASFGFYPHAAFEYFGIEDPT